MTALDLEHESLAAHLPRLHPHLVERLRAAGRRALWMHADEVTVEHLLGACMEDEDCAAHQIVVHAFADPETVDLELTALSPGVMVVGSDGARPFSPRAVEALEAARRSACAARADEVTVDGVLAQAARALPEEDARALCEAGLGLEGLAPTPGGGGLAPDGPLFRGFSEDAKRALAQASKAAAACREPSIGPAQLVLGCLRADPELARRAGLAAARARGLLAGRTADPSDPAPRRLPPQAELARLLGGLPEGAGTLELLIAAARTSEELAGLYARHKLTEALLERARGAFRDPQAGEGGSRSS